MNKMKVKNMINENDQIYKKWLLFVELSGIYNKNKTIYFVHSNAKALFHLLTLMVLLFSGYMFLNEMEKVAEMINNCLILVTLVELPFHSFFCLRDEFKFLHRYYGKTYDYGNELLSNFISDKTKRNEIITKKLLKCFVGGAIIFSVNFLSTWVVRKFVLGEKYPLLFEFYLFLNLEKWEIYYLVILWQIIFVIETSVTVYAYLLSVLLVCLKIKTEIEILQYALENIEEIVEERIKNNSKRDIAVELMKDCIKHHHFILKYFEKAKTCLKLHSFILMGVGVLVYITTGFVMLSDNQQLKVKFFHISLSEAIYLWIFCYQGEIIARKSEDLRFSIYSIQWWKLPQPAKTSLRLIQVRMIRPFNYVSIMGNTITLDTFSNMISGGYSYFSMLIKLY